MRAEFDWDDAYAIADHTPGWEEFPPKWAAAAEAFRAGTNAELDLSYGDGARCRLDLFRPAGQPKGLVVFVHGGYWKAFDKSSWSHLAAGPVAAGWAVAMPSYTLVPEARISQITAEIARAITAAAERVDGPIRLTGHSAGGHLVTRMVCDPSPLPEDVSGRVDGVVSISGVHDLRLLPLTAMNDILRLDAAEARAESPVVLDPLPGRRITAWVGAQERPEFLRQTRALEEAWAAQGCRIDAVYEPGRHHFDVIDALADAGSALTRALLDT